MSDIYSKEQRLLVKRLVQARKDAGLSQMSVAQIAGTTQSYISKIESGQVRIEAVFLNKLANIYKKKLSYFFQ